MNETQAPMQEWQAQNLCNAARAVREHPAPRMFTMCAFKTFDCGTPCCVIGCYAARSDLQQFMSLDGLKRHSFRIDYNSLLKHLGVSDREYEELFHATGCNNAQTPEAAATYIENFVFSKGFGYLVNANRDTVASAPADDLVMKPVQIELLEVTDAAS